jgi:hypothetical protein
MYVRITCTLCTQYVTRVVKSFLTAHNTHRRHLYIIRLTDISLRRKCGTKQGTSAYVLYECKVLVTLIHTWLGPFLLDSAEVRVCMYVSAGNLKLY